MWIDIRHICKKVVAKCEISYLIKNVKFPMVSLFCNDIYSCLYLFLFMLSYKGLFFLYLPQKNKNSSNTKGWVIFLNIIYFLSCGKCLMK